MPIVRITKEQLKKAQKARSAALKKDPEFRAFVREQERLSKESRKQQKREKEAQ